MSKRITQLFTFIKYNFKEYDQKKLTRLYQGSWLSKKQYMRLYRRLKFVFFCNECDFEIIDKWDNCEKYSFCPKCGHVNTGFSSDSNNFLGGKISENIDD